MTPLVGTLAGTYGLYLLYTAACGSRRGPLAGAAAGRGRWRRRSRDWLAQAGLAGVRARQLVTVSAAVFLAGCALTLALFGGVLPALVAGLFAATGPVAWHRARRARRRAEANEAWPRMLEELRLLTGSLGRSVPQALFEVGRRGPAELRPAFEGAQRTWLLSTDFEHALGVLKAGLADPTADAVAETLLVAHQLGGTDLDRRLLALIDDRSADLRSRKDARAKQAGVRYVRAFVLVVPVGMALVGLSIGDGRAAYSTGFGQAAVAAAIAMVVLCWMWAGRLLRLPDQDRTFYE